MNSAGTTRDAASIGARPAGHPPEKGRKVGVLLINLCTPDGTDYK